MRENRKELIAEEKETARIEAFSDGVFAIAITLLVLDIKVPHSDQLPEGVRLTSALLRQWPVYLAYATSFLTILIMWMNHHKLLRHIKHADHLFLLINGLLLMGVTVVPFPTSLLAEYIEHPYAKVAASVYSGTFVGIAVLFNVLWRYASHKGRLLLNNHDPQLVQSITDQYRFGPLMYLVAFGLSFVSVTASIGLCVALVVFFAMPPPK